LKNKDNQNFDDQSNDDYAEVKKNIMPGEVSTYLEAENVLRAAKWGCYAESDQSHRY